ncbi:MAG: hypothetical protein AAGK10_00940, partial [Cyanobacteria bacterium J06555_3]
QVKTGNKFIFVVENSQEEKMLNTWHTNGAILLYPIRPYQFQHFFLLRILHNKNKFISSFYLTL